MDSDLTTLKKPKKKEDSNQRWTKEQEELLASWSERASGYRWLHTRSEKLYRCRNYTFTIPVIILSTLTGTANFAMDSFIPEEHKQVAMACVGGVNIFAGILSTLQNFLRYAELMESHRVAEVSWSKLSRDIAVELTLEPKMRKPAFDFLNVCRAEYDRLIEQSPPIDDDIIKRYKSEFNKLEPDFNHPHVCNGLKKCKVFKYNEDDKKAETLATAGNKFRNLTRKQWEPDFDNRAKRTIKVTNNDIKSNESKKELESLIGLNKVSKFKKGMDKGCDNEAIDNSEKHPMEQINDIIKQTSEHLEKEEINETKDETKSENKDETKSENKGEPDIEKGKIDDDIQIVEEDIIFGDNEKENNEENKEDKEDKEDKEEKTEEELQKEFINSINDK